MKVLLRYSAVLSIGLAIGWALTWFVWSRHQIELFNQATALTLYSEEVIKYKATPKRFYEKVVEGIDSNAQYGVGNGLNPTHQIVLGEETNVLGVGGRWIVTIEVNEDGTCRHIYIAHQPRGYM